MPMQVQLMGFAWYRASEFDDFRTACTDKMADSYEAWLPGAEKGFAEMSKKPGLKVQKVDMGLKDFLAWCEEQGLEPNGKARTRYVNFRLKEMYDRGEIEL